MTREATYLSEELAEIVLACYTSFRPQNPPTTLGVCTSCCMDPKIERAILAKPPQNITITELSDWYSSAFDVSLGDQVVPWLTPRIFDILAQGRAVSDLGYEVTFNRFTEGFPWDKWTTTQTRLFRQFAHAYFSAVLRNKHLALEESFCMFARTNLSIDFILEALQTADPKVLATALVSEAQNGHIEFGTNVFWEKGIDDDYIERIRAFFFDPKLADIFMDLAQDETDPDSMNYWRANLLVSRGNI